MLSTRPGVARPVEQFLWFIASTSQLFSSLPGCWRRLQSGLGAHARSPRGNVHFTFRGAVQPLGLRSTIIGQRGRNAFPDLQDTVLQGGRHRLMHAARVNRAVLHQKFVRP